MKVRNNLRDRDHSSGYRQALRDVVAAIVQNDEAATVATVNARLPSTVAAPDQAHFTQLVLQEFAASHPGNAERFGTDPWRLPRGRKGMVGRVDVRCLAMVCVGARRRSGQRAGVQGIARL